MRRKREENDEVPEVEEVELSEKEQKKLKQKEIIEKRKNAKRKDKVARWGGVILLGLIMFSGFLLWVAGEMKNDGAPTVKTNQSVNPPTIEPMRGSSSGTVIVK